MTSRTTVLALVAALAAMPALAGRPLSTEDASTLGDRASQLEAWVDNYRDATQAWLVPACNFGGGVEWQFGAARTREDGRSAFSEAYFQAKTVLRSLEQSPWGVGVVAGVTRKPLAESHRGWSNPYLLVPLSFKLGDAALVHANVGVSHDHAERRTVTLWGVAAEAPVAPRMYFVAEAFGENAGAPFVRATFASRRSPIASTSTSPRSPGPAAPATSATSLSASRGWALFETRDGPGSRYVRSGSVPGLCCG